MSREEIVSAISETYEKQIAVPPPESKPLRQFFLCPVGLIGAGKTTVIKPLAEQLSIVRISNDEVRELLKKNGQAYETLRDITVPIAERFAKDGWSIAFDADCSNPETREFIESLAQTCGARIIWIHIDPPEAFIIRKLRTKKHTWLFTDGDEAVVNYIRQRDLRREQHMLFDFFATIDTSRTDLDEQIATLERRIKTEVAR